MKKIQLIVLLTFGFVLQAQTNLTKESFSFSLNEAIEHALKNNYSAINANRDIDAAKKKIKVCRKKRKCFRSNLVFI
jgi:hypothetical protein